ncbi:unnamed protein product [Kuraishia capsulata CBS 1993]|uniref:aromatic-amino-acid transaminase n=1 Tax=Kuraishia capsulata CBS 1993 TaxID=1382522 RepID=W6MPD1_9ASCO|nr:uncharacterized protein KUCA_T00004149001 [Kuraishia capsulata CBS 1993]CDK28168.1 unnamed protein product [Kuraishia capsulata CBS 1993]
MTKALDFSKFLSEEAKRREPSPLKSAFKYFSDPNIVFLGGGLPLPDYFPFEKVVAYSPAPPFSNGIDAKPTDDSNTTVVDVLKNNAAAGDVSLAKSLQYGFTEGHTELLAFLKGHTELVHSIPYDDWGLITTVGNTQSWDATLRTFCNPGDHIIVEEYTFSSALETARSQALKFVGAPMDDDGIIPAKLDEILTNWDPAKGKKPVLLYTIPTGQNPTGSSIPTERRKELYKVAQKHDFLIVEDEPYYFLQMDPYVAADGADKEKPVAQTHEEFLKALVTSFISIDTDGRVIRLDSFSKVLAPGVRLGWIVAQDNLLERYVRLHEVSIQTASGFSQSLVQGLLNRWGQKGYLDWLIGLRHEYTEKRDFAINSIVKNVPSSISHYVPPVAGMFFTVFFDVTKHPKYVEFGKDPLKVENAIYERALECGSLMIPGSWFKTPAEDAPPFGDHIFFRGTYAAVPLDQLELGIQRFGDAVKLEYGL